jgi:hypothetical protein
MTQRLTLIAQDAEDLQTLSACLQDALVRVGDMKFFADQNRFALLANRFRWEVESNQPVSGPDGTGRDQRFETAVGHERVHCGVAFDNVRGIKLRGIERDERSRLLNLLTIQASDAGILLVFSGEAALLLECSDIACQLRDLDEPWPTPWRPRHAPAEQV